jgi:protein-S-isoprenylcysteine O-methyltransferase Ste14
MTPTIAKAIWFCFVVAWWALRYPHERRAKKAQVTATKRDATELTLLGISLSGLGIIPMIYVFTTFGLVPALGALWLFYRTHKELGRNWSVSLELRDKHELITRGVYRYVRHPMYSAFFLWAVAQALLLPNWIAGFSGIVGFGTLFLFRVGREEQLMIEAFGDQYRAYMARTARVIPWIY